MWIINTLGAVAAITVFAIWFYAVGSEWKTNLDTLFSGLAFVGIIYSVLFQGKEIRLTQKELERSATAQEKSQVELAKQINTMNKSAVLSGLASLLTFHHNEEKYYANLGNHNKAKDHRDKAQDAAKRIEDLTKEIQAEGLKIIDLG